MKIKDLYRKIRDGKIISDIGLQRDIVYNDEKQELVIDSIVNKIPLPAFYFWKNKNGKLEVLDGKQRIHAIKRFMENDIKYNKKLWQETSPSIQKKIDDTELVDIICNLLLAKHHNYEFLNIFSYLKRLLIYLFYKVFQYH